MAVSVNRRKFLKILGASTCGAAVHNVISPYENMMALAQAGGGSKVLIVVNLAGGCSYNITPVYHGAYRDKSPTISFAEADSLPLTSEQGLHPSLSGIRPLWDEGHLALLNLVGYPNPNRSHDESTDIWFRGMRQMSAATGGWGARLTCQMGTIFGGVSLGGTNLLITGDCNPPRAFASLDQNAFGESGLSGASSRTSQFMRITRDHFGIDSTQGSENFSYVKSQADNLQLSLETVRNATNRTLPAIAPVQFPNSGFGNSCRDAARLLNAPELGTQFIYLQRGGFDTHAGERNALTGNLNDVNAGLTALVATAKALGRWQDITIVTMSEFSRTFENGSAGTDHGHAAPMLVMGGRVRGGILTPVPTAAETTSQGYYHNFHVDFRGVFYEIIRFMGYDPLPVFPEPFYYTGINVLA